MASLAVMCCGAAPGRFLEQLRLSGTRGGEEIWVLLCGAGLLLLSPSLLPLSQRTARASLQPSHPSLGVQEG